MHSKGFSFVWERTCRSRCSVLEKDREQIGHKRDCRCCRLCRVDMTAFDQAVASNSENEDAPQETIDPLGAGTLADGDPTTAHPLVSENFTPYFQIKKHDIELILRIRCSVHNVHTSVQLSRFTKF